MAHPPAVEVGLPLPYLTSLAVATFCLQEHLTDQQNMIFILTTINEALPCIQSMNTVHNLCIFTWYINLLTDIL
jgi:hypothetical protein